MAHGWNHMLVAGEQSKVNAQPELAFHHVGCKRNGASSGKDAVTMMLFREWCGAFLLTEKEECTREAPGRFIVVCCQRRKQFNTFNDRCSIGPGAIKFVGSFQCF